MDALGPRSRFRFAPVLEWLIAASFLAATVAVGAMILEELKVTTRRASPAAAAPAAVNVPAVIPARSVSVPILPFRDGKELRIGDTLAAVAEKFGRAAEMGRQVVDRGSLGERLTRFYEYAGARFVVVFEPLERDGDIKVAAIYLQ
jgi:hypothetical protein